ncbi:MAG: chorismate synthase, partial [bacterium]
NESRKPGDTLGGSVRAIAAHVPPGLGSCSLPDERLDANIAKAAMAIPGVKAVEIGSGIAQSHMNGKDAHDLYSINTDPLNKTWFGRSTNFCGGIEGGISNGEPISVTVMIKPISTVNPPNPSIDLQTRKGAMPKTSVRSDICAVEAVACVLEALLAIELTKAHRDKFGGDTIDESYGAFNRFMKSIM